MLTNRRKECLVWFATRRPGDVIPATEKWDRRQHEWALKQDYLAVGPSGYHEITPAGRAALQDDGET